MITIGLFGALSSHSPRWGFYGVSCFFEACIGYGLLVPGIRGAYSRGKALGSFYTALALLLFITWWGYPIVWGFAEGSNYISVDAEVGSCCSPFHSGETNACGLEPGLHLNGSAVQVWQVLHGHEVMHSIVYCRGHKVLRLKGMRPWYTIASICIVYRCHSATELSADSVLSQNGIKAHALSLCARHQPTAA